MTLSIELDGVSFAYREKAVVKDISASIEAGEFTCLLGPNGAGKTTLAQLIAGELSPVDGRIFLHSEEDVVALAGLNRHIAYLPQDIQDPPFVTVKELVSLGRFEPNRSLGWSVSGDDEATVRDCMARCLTESFADRPFTELSGGEKQRVWLAFCLAQQREFLLLDESLHNMDYAMRGLFFGMLSDLAAVGKGIFLITHDLHMAMRHGRRMLVMKSGELVYDGPPDQGIYSLM